MPSHDDDADLRAIFGALRHHEQSRAPEFTIEPPAFSRPARGRAPRIAFAFALILIVIVFATTRHRALPPAPPPDVVANWKAPTDFLLSTPQIELLKDTPRFGERNVMR